MHAYTIRVFIHPEDYSNTDLYILTFFLLCTGQGQTNNLALAERNCKYLM